jgi:hypothetical protein
MPAMVCNKSRMAETSLPPWPSATGRWLMDIKTRCGTPNASGFGSKSSWTLGKVSLMASIVFRDSTEPRGCGRVLRRVSILRVDTGAGCLR